MNLEKYLDAIKNAKDEDLISEFGIDYDNLPILVGVDFQTLVSVIDSSKKFVCISMENKFFEGNWRSYDEINGKGFFQVYDTLVGYAVPGEMQRTQEEIIHNKKITSTFSCSLTLHSYSNFQVEFEGKRTAANLTDTLCRELALKKNIPICLPWSMGMKYWDKKTGMRDFSRMIYYPDFNLKLD